MAPIAPIFRRAYIVLGLAVTLYASSLFLVTIPFFQRHVIYVHKLQFFWQNVNKPEQFGFARNQVTPFKLKTPDDELLYAWHVLPLALYGKHEGEMKSVPSGFVNDITKSKSFALLRDDPEARLVIEFHGNTNHVAQGWRTESYKSLSSISPEKIHVLAIDYRGFGFSTGTPSEQGLIIDGIATVNWALNVARIPPSRIVLVGQSLGTAVTAAIASHFAVELQVDFAGVVLIAPFTSMPTLLTEYSLGGWIPFFAPLTHSPRLLRLFLSKWRDTWDTATRLGDLISHSRKCKLYLIHAKNDFDIPWTHSNAIFAAAANATSTGDGYSVDLFEKMKTRHTIYSEDGGFVSEWKVSQNRVVTQIVLATGGHNRIMTYSQTALAVWRAFGLDKEEAQTFAPQPTEYYVT